MRRWCIAACVLLLAGSAAAQGSPRARRGRSTPRLTGARRAEVQQALAAARAAAEAAPAWAAPQLLISVARAGLPQFRSQALADDTAAFRLALALPSPADPSTPAGQAREQIKRNAELEAVSELARNAGAAAALALVRLADVPKAPLYDQLLLGARLSPAAALNLVQECELQGTFPYRGAAALVERRRIRGFDLTALLTDGYLRAGDETGPRQISAAVFFLQAGRRAAPALDGTLETAAVALLRRLAGDQPAAAAATGFERSAAVRLLALLRAVDPPRAAQWAVSHPGFALAGPAYGYGYFPGGGNVRFAFALRPRLGPAAVPSSVADEPVAQFLARLNQAERDQRRDPDAALAAADRAGDLLNQGLWDTQAPAAARLALIYARVGDSADAANLMAQCLDQAGREARQADAAYDNAGAAGQAQQALHLQAASWPVTAIYGLAARLDFTTALERAENANFTLDKPFVLARLALIAQLGRAR